MCLVELPHFSVIGKKKKKTSEILLLEKKKKKLLKFCLVVGFKFFFFFFQLPQDGLKYAQASRPSWGTLWRSIHRKYPKYKVQQTKNRFMKRWIALNRYLSVPCFCLLYIVFAPHLISDLILSLFLSVVSCPNRL